MLRLLPICAALLAACTESHYVGSTATTGASAYREPSRVHARDVRIYQTPPKQPFEEIGIIETRQGLLESGSASSLMEDMRSQGAEQGCDAVLIVGSADEVVGGVYGGPGTNGAVYGSISTRKGYRGSCIVFSKLSADSARERQRKRDSRHVSKTWSEGRLTIRSSFGDDELQITVSGDPSASATEVTLELRMRRKVDYNANEQPAVRHDGCALQLSMGDKGEASVAQTAFEATERFEQWSGQTQLQAVAKLALGDEVSGALCDTKFRIGSESRAKLAGFARIFAEAAGKANKSSATAKTPDGAAPALPVHDL